MCRPRKFGGRTAADLVPDCRHQKETMQPYPSWELLLLLLGDMDQAADMHVYSALASCVNCLLELTSLVP